MKNIFLNWFFLKKNKKIPNVCGFSSNENIYTRIIINNLKKKFFKKSIKNPNYHKIDASKINLKKIINYAKTLPILDKKRFIEIYNCSKINKNQLNYLNNYIKNYSKKTVLIFNIEKFNNSISLSSILKKHKCLYFFKQPNNKELLEITLTISNLKNIFLNKNLANLIINKFEKKFLLIYNFIITSKFILNNKKITIEYIQKNITNLNFIDYLNFIKTIIKFKKKKIITYLILFINKKENPKKILYFIGWQFQIFLKIKICLNSGKELKEISKYSNTPIRHIRISFLLIEKFNTNKLKYIIKLLKTFDWMMKYLNFNQNSFIEIHNLLIKEIH